MPATKREKPLYQRGKYALYRRADRTNLEIVWYDDQRKRERSASARTGDVGKAKIEVDRLYLADTGTRSCPTCGRAWDHTTSPLVLQAIADYLILSEDKVGIKSARTRLGHVTDFLAATDPTITCAQADAAWVTRFRKWMTGRPTAYSLSHIEGCIMQVAAAINATPGERALFKAEQQKAVSRTPDYRADVKTLAAMFDYCLNPKARTKKEATYFRGERTSLLRYLRMAVATWARPDAILDVSARQWNGSARVLDMNPPGRRQTKKFRPKLPIAHQFAPWLDELEGNWLDITVISQPWTKMARRLGLPAGRESGPKLIRRSMATLARRRMGEANWRQGEMMLGHVKASISDVYAIPDPANLGLALAVTEEIIDEIEALAPGAYRNFTAPAATLKLVKGGQNG